MADAVAINYVYPPNYDDAPNPMPTRKVVVRMRGLSDGTGETDIVKVRLNELMKHDGQTPTRTAVEKIVGNVYGQTVLLEWDRAPNAEIKLLSPGRYNIDYTDVGGLIDPGEEGDRTGNILLSTVYSDSGDSYDLTLTVRLK